MNQRHTAGEHTRKLAHALKRPDNLIPLLGIIAFLIAAWGSQAIFERLPHVEDEVAYVFQAKTFAEGEFIARAPDQPEFFRMPFIIIKDGQWFGKYPPGYPLQLSLGEIIGQTWVINALAGAIAVVIVGYLGRRIYSTWTGIAASALMVASPFFLLQTSSLMSHPTGLLWAMVAIASFWHMRTRGSQWGAAGVGLAMGMLLLTRPLTAVGVGAPLAILALIDLIRNRELRYPLTMALTFLPFAASLLLYNHATTGHPLRSAYELWWPYDRIGFGEDVGRNGHSLGDAVTFLKINLDALSHDLFGWPGRWSIAPVILGSALALFDVARGFVYRARFGVSRLPRTTQIDLLLIAICVSVAASHMLYWTSGQMYGPRYYFEAIGALALLSARGLVRPTEFFIRWFHRTRPRLQFGYAPAVAAGMVFLVLTSHALVTTTPDRIDDFRGWNGVSDDDLSEVHREELRHALVFIPRENWTDFAPFFVRNSPHLDDNVIYASYRDHFRSLALMREYPDREIYIYQDGELRLIRDAS